jgi:hypothetical protein
MEFGRSAELVKFVVESQVAFIKQLSYRRTNLIIDIPQIPSKK